jgi:pSer/pThr/pTyr-binding forkhead associated (FHA) protein
VIAPAPERRRILIEVSSLVIGRAPGGGATLALRSQDVSRRHCRIDIGPQGAVLSDLGSTNGTLLDGARLTAPVRLLPGARLTIGTFVLEYEGEIAGTVTRTD